MLSSRYTFKRCKFKYNYINGFIDYQAYISLLEDIKKEELRSVVFDFKQREMEEEVCAFEVQQMNQAYQERSIRKKNEDLLRLQVEVERTKQLEAIKQQKAEEAKMQPQTLEEKLLEAREIFTKKLGTGIYRGRSIEESLSIFAENTNNTISEHKKQQQLLDQPPDVKSAQVSQ